MHSSPALDAALATTAAWDVGFVACAVRAGTGRLAARGDLDRCVRIASVTKPLVGYAACIAVEEGTLDLDEPIGRVGTRDLHPTLTVRHLLAHAGGYGFDGPDPLSAPGRRRMYSNTGFEVLGSVLSQRADMSIEEYLDGAVLSPLQMMATTLRGSPAKDVWSTVADLDRFLAELLAPSLISGATFAAFTSVQFPALAGIVPEVGTFNPCPWGLGVEVRGDKSPHWTGRTNSPATFGHFGGSGTFAWVDPDATGGPLAMVCLTDRQFGPWSLSAWPDLSDAVLAARSRPDADRWVPEQPSR